MHSNNDAYNERNALPTVKHVGGSMILWEYFATSGAGGFDDIVGMMRDEDYQSVLEHNVLPSVTK